MKSPSRLFKTVVASLAGTAAGLWVYTSGEDASNLDVPMILAFFSCALLAAVVAGME